MNRQLSNKPSKKDRPRSTDKSVKAKKKGDQTPEKVPTPVPSSAGVADEAGQGNQAINNVLSGEDIDSLAVNIEELQKNRPPKRPVTEKSSRQVTVRKSVKMKDLSNAQTKNGKIVTVAHPANEDPEFDSYKKLESKDPCIDDLTPFFEHHILGTLQEFREQNEKSLQSKKIPMSQNEKSHVPAPATKIIKGRTFPSHIYKPNMDQSNALTNWERQMSKRRKQQGNLARLLHTSTEMLGMNQNEEYRTTQEERHLIDRSIHAKDYGKGYRIGSEFWKQAELIGDDDTGIHMTLTQTERGYPPVVEHVAKPITVRKEMGFDWSDTESYRSTLIHHPWRKSEYLHQRKEELRDLIEELCPHKPYLQELEVVGQSVDNENITLTNNQDSPTTKMDSVTTLIDKISQDEIDPLSMHPDIYPQPIFGPSLMIAGRSAAWNGSTNNRVGEIGVSCRVVLESKVKERVVSILEVQNNGSAAVYYSWKYVPMENTLGTSLAGQEQRFYFDKNSGVILPGDTLRFPFTFKSTNPGMFSEQWQLDTQPVLNGGAAIRVLLKGLALQDDLNAEKRAALEVELGQRQARQIVQSILNEMLDCVRTPERPCSPIDAYLTDEELFARKNPEVFYDEEIVKELKQLYNDIDPEGDWDLSLLSLRQLITAHTYDDDERMDGYLCRLNEHVNKLSFPPRIPNNEEMYSTCYTMLCDMVDQLVAKSNAMRTSLGLPVKDIVEDSSLAADEAPDKKSRKTDPGRLNVDKKDGKKDKKAGERPVSTQKLKTPTDKTKPTARGSGTSSAQAKLSTEDIHETANNFVMTISDALSPAQTVSVVTEDYYKEKLFLQAYEILCETVDRIAGIFQDIQVNSRTGKDF
ncbi:MYCBP-associated protein-like [Dendronephthya gigantea]|uniref:MYCBP-associated protein-like n=1 Tax=Dendronephthya gigantea TaxID=151771 RepID=UPI00106D86A0|nr:MYCBP-associated protein-like [Dendronephthya gigantea]